ERQMRANAECDERVRGRRLVACELAENTRVVAEAREADPGPAHDRKCDGESNRATGGSKPTCERQPDRERPEEQLEDDRTADRPRGRQQAVAPVPRNGNREQKQRLDRPQVNRAAREPEEPCEGIAPPVP